MGLHPQPNPPNIPTRLDELLGFSVVCPCGQTHLVELRRASIGHGALGDLVEIAREVGSGQSIVIVADEKTRPIAGDRAVQLLESDNHRTSLCLLPDGAGGRPHADEPTLQLVEDALTGADLAVAVGSGTINDLTKLASFNRHIPYLAVATAPSMNGYTSAIAAIMLRGVKRTLPCHQPFGIVADLDVLARAPHELIAAGLGDLESKPTATADFRLGGMLRNTYYCPAPEQVVFAAEQRAAQSASGLAQGSTEAIASLTEALILSGISMKLAGTSGPASGGEHLISHFWDMTATAQGRLEGWHGAQVGVATIVCAALYEHLREVDPASIDVEAIVAKRPPGDALEKTITARHGIHGTEVWQEFSAKRLSSDELTQSLEQIRNNWDELWRRLSSALRPAERIRDILHSAGAPVTINELGLTPAHLITAFHTAREIRNRYTVLDFAAELGLLDEIADKVLQTSGCLI